MTRLLIIALLNVLTATAALADGFEHHAWDGLLKRHVFSIEVGVATQVDYEGVARDHDELKDYLGALAMVSEQDFASWPDQTQLAFLINAYNAWTVELILSEWPDLVSIKDLGGLFQSPWKKTFIPLLGEMRSLDDIEHGMIRGSDRYRDPRIHFAVNCASIGCPALRPEAYEGEKLEKQLQEQTRLFLSDRKRNRLAGSTLYLSSIFKWYREDFEKGWLGFATLTEFLGHYTDALGLTPSALQQLHSGEMNISYLDYDWRLNARR